MPLFNRATGIEERLGLSYWYAAILAAKMLEGETVYLEDFGDRGDCDGVRVINPFFGKI